MLQQRQAWQSQVNQHSFTGVEEEEYQDEEEGDTMGVSYPGSGLGLTMDDDEDDEGAIQYVSYSPREDRRSFQPSTNQPPRNVNPIPLQRQGTPRGVPSMQASRQAWQSSVRSVYTFDMPEDEEYSPLDQFEGGPQQYRQPPAVRQSPALRQSIKHVALGGTPTKQRGINRARTPTAKAGTAPFSRYWHKQQIQQVRQGQQSLGSFAESPRTGPQYDTGAAFRDIGYRPPPQGRYTYKVQQPANELSALSEQEEADQRSQRVYRDVHTQGRRAPQRATSQGGRSFSAKNRFGRG